MKIIILIFSAMLVSSAAFAYTPPIGIPDPGDTWTTVHPIDTANPDTTAFCPGWYEGTPRANSTAAGDARNCYYVDSADGCTDSSNTYGYPGNARCTVPAQNPSSAAHAAGTYFEIYGGTGRSTYTWTPNFGQGTGANPIWVVGKNDPTFTGTILIGNYYASVSTISYVIMDGLKLTGRLKINLMDDGLTYSNICFRNGKINQSAAGQADGIAVGTDRSIVTFTSWSTSAITDVVVYNNDIGPIGDKTAAHEEICGFHVTPKATNLFVLENDIHDAVEDGVCGGHDTFRLSSYIYVGKNNIYANMTNAIDIKHLSDVVISENNIYSGVGADERYVLDEGVVVIHYAGDSPGSGTNERYKNYPENVWFIFNTVHDADYGLVFSTVENAYVIGNVFYNIHNLTMDPAAICTADEIPNKCCTGDGTGSGCPESWTAGINATGAALKITGVRGDAYIANNTVYDSDGGMMVFSGGSTAYDAETTYYRAYTVSYDGAEYYCIDDDAGTGITNVAPSDTDHWAPTTFHVTDNIVSDRAETTFYDYAISSTGALSDFDRNLVYSSGSPYIFWTNSTQRNMAYIFTNTDYCGTSSDTCIETDPKFASTTSTDGSFLKLQSDSPAIGAGSESAAYNKFNALYSISIEKDRAGVSRPQPPSGTWDIGAYEYDPNVATPQISGAVISGAVIK